jgi:hypothetical protein
MSTFQVNRETNEMTRESDGAVFESVALRKGYGEKWEEIEMRMIDRESAPRPSTFNTSTGEWS